jgi:hypothetical protein
MTYPSVIQLAGKEHMIHVVHVTIEEAVLYGVSPLYCVVLFAEYPAQLQYIIMRLGNDCFLRQVGSCET